MAAHVTMSGHSFIHKYMYTYQRHKYKEYKEYFYLHI